MEPKCNLIIDSCCDLPPDMVRRDGVDLVEFPFVLDGRERLDDAFSSLTAKEFYDVMRDRTRVQPTTAQVPTSMFVDVFSRALASGVPTVYLSFTSGLSGSFDTACLVRDELAGRYPEGELYVVDTLLASIAEGVLVLGALEQRAKGLTAQQMVAWAEEARFYVNSQFMVEDMEALRRGGRIPAGVAFAGAKLDVKPVLGFDLEGHLTLTGMTRGRKKGLRQLVEYYERRVDLQQPARRVIVAHADCEKDMRRLRDDVARSDEGAIFQETAIGPVIGSHVGPGMVALAFWGPDRRREQMSVADRIAQRVKER